MTEKQNFNSLVEQAMQTSGWQHMRPAVEKELLHYDILFALDREGFLENLVFQGGTCLRLCYGSSRLSEDLDFACGDMMPQSALINIKDCLETYIGKRYGFDVGVKTPKQVAAEPRYGDIKVSLWQINITTAPQRKDLPKQKIRIEIASVPAYTTVPRTLQMNYAFLPDGYEELFVLSKSLDEIMADKLISLVNCQKYIRHRDIWDLHWLTQQRAVPKAELIMHKIKDYRIDDYLEKLSMRYESLASIIFGEDFRVEMSRFLSTDTQKNTLERKPFKELLVTNVGELLQETKKLMS